MKPFYWALTAALVWGFAPIIEKIGLAKIPVFMGLFYRCLGVALGAVILALWKWDALKQAVVAPPQGWGFLLLGGFLASVVGQICFYHALKDGEASVVVPLGASYPLVSFLLGLMFLGEKVTFAKAGGLFFVLLGVILLR